MQLTHYNTTFKSHRFPITLVCDNITSTPNIGSLFRICDAFGASKLLLCGERINMGRKISKTSRATEKAIDFEIKPSALEVVAHLKNEQAQIISLEITQSSIPIHHFKFSIEKPIVLVVGNENFGVSETILKLSDHTVHINMFGQNSSMNVVQATNIALYEITKQLIAFTT
ncbi:MAG: TrmH family RNA methyltransferase [Aestuariibaculum sp.]